VAQVLAGLISQLADTEDPLELFRQLGSYADRGRRLAVVNTS
jgi:hypothetical protein